MRRWGAIVVAALCLVPAAASAAPRQAGSFTFTSTTPGTPTGTTLDVVFQNPDDPDLKPYAAAQMVVHAPPGTVVDTTVPPQCHATDAEIYVLGPEACPPESRIGDGLAETDNGGGDPRYSKTDLTHFNNQDEVVGIGVNRDVPAIKTIDRTRLDGRTSTSTFPLFPGVPPPEPYTPVKTLHIHFPPYERAGRAYIRTPRSCPRSGYWTFVVEFTYRDGATESISSRSACTGAR